MIKIVIKHQNFNSLIAEKFLVLRVGTKTFFYRRPSRRFWTWNQYNLGRYMLEQIICLSTGFLNMQIQATLFHPL